MKKILMAGIIGILIGGLFFLFIQKPDTPRTLNETVSKANNPTTQEKQTESSVSIENPEILHIPSIGVSSAVEHVGLDAQKRMDVPKDYQNVAWYELGYKPGETGSAVIAGHFDTPTGSPGVFYDLSKLENGDEIIIEGEGKTLTYTVVNSSTYAFDQVPLNMVFDSKDKKRLNLITCEGVFNKSSQNYSKRLVVYAVLDE